MIKKLIFILSLFCYLSPAENVRCDLIQLTFDKNIEYEDVLKKFHSNTFLRIIEYDFPYIKIRLLYQLSTKNIVKLLQVLNLKYKDINFLI